MLIIKTVCKNFSAVTDPVSLIVLLPKCKPMRTARNDTYKYPQICTKVTLCNDLPNAFVDKVVFGAKET